MFKKIFFQIHWFLGITAGLILSIMGITGAIYSYEQPIQEWLNPDSYYVEIAPSPKLTPSEIYLHFQRVQPEMQLNSISIAQEANASSSINIVKEGARRGQNLLINPYTAEILPEIKGREFFAFIQQLHRFLTIGDTGKQITGASTLMLIFFVLSGVYLRWPKKHTWRQWFAIKPKLKGRNFLWDLHAVVGTWMVVFYLVLACTGLYWSYDWWRSGMFKVMGVAPPQQNSAPKTPTDKQKPELEKLSTAQVTLALQQTWTGIGTQLDREYSSMTLSIPKKPDGIMELTFVDNPAQHERARNKANYNYQAQQFEKIELYQDKKLNEKIMSSMLPVHRGSFFGPVVQFLVMLAALTMPLFFITGWMLYLKRRKQKKLTLTARRLNNSTQLSPDNPQDVKVWLVSYASQTGVAEQLAWRTASSLQEAGQAVSVKAMQQLSTEDLLNAQQILFVASTYGTGEAPDLASSFEKKIMSLNLDLGHLNYAVLALGSMEYPQSYCSFGHRIAAWLERNGAQALFKTIEVDNGNDQDIERWNTALAKATQVELQSMSVEKVFDPWILRQRDLLNPGSLGAAAYNIELQAKHEVMWQAGDIAEVQPQNSPERIAQFLKHYPQAATLIPPTALQAHATVQTIQQHLADRDLTGSVQDFATLDQLLVQLPILPTREYSIASIPTQGILRLVVRQQQDESGDLGLGSGYLTEHSQIEDGIALRIRTNSSFHLISDNRPIICIGNGTGIAGLMSLLHARQQAGFNENWLIFGERQREHDYFYQACMQSWQETQLLKRLDLAFSRDQAEKIYVHHLLRQYAEQLKAWIENDAVIYICGSIQGMASDVDQALIDILGEEQVDQLRIDGRYRRDVY
ncbi:sulfite reductase (NADPH) flavoprotein alpha-component [Acinetobacter calcoaceticus]|uniref:Sulfite reductase (NADPH) flavoprotein alpha-component n=1 Tax=Acinetobacter calcoaceticus TaxID=471 RepID=A0A4R1Y1C4_ACICA|nr:sulfite reductase (NADPH) flavoprotein alpha-component [Acinetobacter calcoaceticus]